MEMEWWNGSDDGEDREKETTEMRESSLSPPFDFVFSFSGNSVGENRKTKALSIFFFFFFFFLIFFFWGFYFK